ncbi:MAG: hypothetical protein ACRDO8_07310, partial [Nocardioidaceae bacterium]
MSALEEAADALAHLPGPASSAAALDESDRLLRVNDLITLTLDQRIGLVDRTGQAKASGHSSTTAWLRNGTLPDPAGKEPAQDSGAGLTRGPASGGRMGAGAAAAHKRNGRQFVRLPDTVAAVRAGLISHAMG